MNLNPWPYSEAFVTLYLKTTTDEHVCNCVNTLSVVILSSFLACNSRSRRAMRRPHPPQRPVLGHIYYFRQYEIRRLV